MVQSVSGAQRAGQRPMIGSIRNWLIDSTVAPYDVDSPVFSITRLWYILSGGVKFRQLLPDSLTAVAKLSERVLAPFNPWVALQQTIALRKKQQIG